jgi:DivIVA domain-containing protein
VPWEASFTIVLRGYDVNEVRAAMNRAGEALASSDPALRAAVRDELRRATFTVVLRGYDRSQVDEYCGRAVAALELTEPVASGQRGVLVATEVDFTVVLRGYAIDQVRAAARRAEEALASSDPALRAAVRDELRRATFRVVFRGYDRSQVDGYVAGVVEALG